MRAYIEIIGESAVSFRRDLTDMDLQEIGEFTRENVLRWMGRQKKYEWGDYLARRSSESFLSCFSCHPIQDFHAVCGDMTIPWAEEMWRLRWNEEYSQPPSDKPKTGAYIDIICQHATFRHYLTASELPEIGEFTRENVARFSNSRNRPYGWAEFQPTLDFHAVCGDTEISWADEKWQQKFDEIFPQGPDKDMEEMRKRYPNMFPKS